MCCHYCGSPHCVMIRQAVWSKPWNLFFNGSKCSLVRFGLHVSSSSHVYSINSCEIQSNSQHKDLGIIVSSDLSWTNHILYVTTKLTKSLAFNSAPYSNSFSIISGHALLVAASWSGVHLFCAKYKNEIHVLSGVHITWSSLKRDMWMNEVNLGNITLDILTTLLELGSAPCCSNTSTTRRWSSQHATWSGVQPRCITLNYS